MSDRFVACLACARHVKVGQCICPFCGAKAPCAKPARSIAGRVTRAALSAAGAAGAVVALNDCTAQSYPLYGGVCVPDACGGYVEDTGVDTAVIAEASVGEASSTSDAGEPDVQSEPDARDGAAADAAPTTDASTDGPKETE